MELRLPISLLYPKLGTWKPPLGIHTLEVPGCLDRPVKSLFPMPWQVTVMLVKLSKLICRVIFLFRVTYSSCAES